VIKMAKDQRFQEWALELAKAAIKHPDKTFRQLMDEWIVPSWTDYFLEEISQEMDNTTIGQDPFYLLAQMGGLVPKRKKRWGLF